MATWNPNWPNWRQTGCNLTEVDGVLRSDLPGPTASRRLHDQAMARQAASIYFTQTLFGLFEAWYQHDLRGGAAWAQLVPVRDDSDVQLRSVRLVGGYQAQRQGKGWLVETELEWRT